MDALVTPETVRIMMGYILRHTELLTIAAAKLPITIFMLDGWERCYSILYEITLDFNKKYNSLPNREILKAELSQYLNNDPYALTEDQKKETLLFIEEIFQPEYSDLGNNREWVLLILKEFLRERLVVHEIHRDLSQNLPVEQLLRKLSDNLSKTNIGQIEPVDVFSTMNSDVIESRCPTGCQWFDILTGGGIYERGGEIIGFLGAAGWGKTLAGIELAVCSALRGYTVAYFCYEQPVSGKNAFEMVHRVITCATGITDKKLRKGTNSFTPDELKAYKLIEARLSKKILFFDMSGVIPGVGMGGAMEVEGYLKNLELEGRKPNLVIIDWFGYALSRKTKAGSTGAYEDSKLTVTEIGDFNILGTRYGTTFLILQQLGGEGAKRGNESSPSQGDVAGAKSFSHLMGFCIQMTKPDELTHTCKLVAVKARANAPRCLMVQRDGVRNVFNILEVLGKKPEPIAGSEGEDITGEDFDDDIDSLKAQGVAV
jgi:hypothetical protein